MSRIEIQMLGPMLVRRSDGSAVTAGEWRTAKTLDLLRLLALHNGEAVPAASLLLKLWPDVDESRGRASLRTAASQLRKVLGEDCVDRRAGGLVLQNAWVDTQAFLTLVGDAAASRRAGDHARVVATVEEAEALYVGDLDVSDAPRDWLFEARDHLREARCRALLDASDAAASLCWMRDSLELATRAAEIDTCEESSRALMRALAGVGELDKALGVFERVRRDLAERYGVDPSPQTRALHLQLLTGTADRRRHVGLVGHADAQQALTATLTRLIRQAPGGGLVWLVGEPGSGRDALAAAACREAGLLLHDLSVDPWGGAGVPLRIATADVPDSDVLLMPHAESVPQHAQKMLDTLALQHGGVLIVPVSTAPAVEDARHVTVAVGSLGDGDLALLAELVLQGMPSDRLLRVLRAESSGLSGLVCRVARTWLAEGRVVWSVDGLELADGGGPRVMSTFASLRRTLRLMSPFAEDVVDALAVAEVEVGADDLLAVVRRLRPGADADEVRAALSELVEAEIVVRGIEGYRLREGNAHPEIVAWMRPRLRQRMHLIVAEEVPMVVQQRQTLLVAAGERAAAEELGALPETGTDGHLPEPRRASGPGAAIATGRTASRRAAERFYGAVFGVLLHPDLHLLPELMRV